MRTLLAGLLLTLAMTGCASEDTPDSIVKTDEEPGKTPELPWRSALYAEDWTPSATDAEGHFLHDFSYAGYRQGTVAPGAPADAAVFDVVGTYGADPAGATDVTAAVQQAIDDASAQGGGVVHFPAGLYRVEGVLSVIASGVVLRGEGPEVSRLYFTRSEGMSDTAHLTFAGAPTSDLDVPLRRDGAPREDVVEVDDAGDLAKGDDLELGWVISPAFIDEHGMAGTWEAFNDTWQPFFRRTVIDVDRSASPHRVVLDVPLRYPAKVRDLASLRRVRGLVRACGVESLGVSTAVGWDAAWTAARTHAIALRNVADCWIRDVASFPSPAAPESGPGAGAHLMSGGVLLADAKQVTVADTHLGFAQNRGVGGNGYLFEVQRGGEILIRDSQGEAGRHNFIQNWGFGTTGCVLLRVESRGGAAMLDKDESLDLTGMSEFHHSLAMANLVDASLFDDGFSIVNRNEESTGAGHTGTQNVLWGLRGEGVVRSLQFGVGYLIGTQGLSTVLESPLPMGQGTEPVDWSEGLDQGALLEPASLYEDQLRRRLDR
ncbi:glycosyl hydrolase family 28-related protein [Chondromyces apiculatus]|nr:glycosyl hydrolase family 28-related protein [Chondromyces apiculatus]